MIYKTCLLGSVHEAQCQVGQHAKAHANHHQGEDIEVERKGHIELIQYSCARNGGIGHVCHITHCIC